MAVWQSLWEIERHFMTARDPCARAIAYLKPVVEDSAPAISLSWDDSPVLRPFTDDLVVSYVVDAGDNLTFIQNRHLEQENVSVDQLHAMAVLNLQAFAEEKLVVHEYGSIYVALMGGEFEAGLLTLNVMWSHWYGQLAQEGFIAVAPARDILAFCDASSPQGILELQQVIARSADCDHPLPPRMYQRTGTDWKPFPIER